MTALAGKNAAVKNGASTIAEMDEWTFTPSIALHEKTKFGDAAKNFLAGLQDGTIALKGRHDQTDATGQAALWTAFLAGTSVTIYMETDAVGNHGYTVAALIKDLQIKAAVSGLVDITINLQANGSPAYS